MNTRKLLLILAPAAALLLSAVLLAAFVGPGVKRETPSHNPATVAVQVAEDDPAWDCATMGNKQCGPGAVPLSDYCQAEASNTVEGVEVITYAAGTVVWHAGLAYPCPS